ncbi:IS1182 family transposase [Evansella halocellulosilytica]|uniref:IS1182 family transposase n=1 Tax=Evansella halocellulosilytica TaxID=2011013 RepID=UPI000BB98EDF|nr:IS1182 family transposase [Evansella halocellulosilytica]
MFKQYNMNQVILPLDMERKLHKDDIAFTIHEMIEGIPEEAFEPFLRETGTPSYHPKMMMKVILCAYTQSVFSGRKIEALVQDSVRMMWLAQGYEPSYRTINRFRVNLHVQDLLRECFVQFRSQLVEEKVIDQEAVFIDGTKIEANANKYTFVWRKSTERHSQNLIEKSNTMYEELLEQEVIPAMERESSDELSTEELQSVVNKLDDHIEDFNQKIESSDDTAVRKQLRSDRKKPKEYQKQFKDFLQRKQKYQTDMEIFGERNSYSKTDHDATFMRMKDDHMRNGQLKAGYNVQLATENQYALAYDVFPNPTDVRTLIPFLDRIENDFFELPRYIVADAGYGSEQNYQDVHENREREALITFNTYRKEKTKKYQKDPSNSANWAYDEEKDAFTCPNGQQVSFLYTSQKKDRYGFTRTVKVYECEDCSSCPLRAECNKRQSGRNRRIYFNPTWEEQKAYIREQLSETKTGELYGQRKIDVEPVFGFLKANLRFSRMSVRGTDKVKNELGFAFMAVNLRKYTSKPQKVSGRTPYHSQKKDSDDQKMIIRTFFYS